MEDDWRIKLKEKVKDIRARGGPHKHGQSIVVPTELSQSEFEVFIVFMGKLNELPFGDAPSGTLEIHSLTRGKEGHTLLFFMFYPKAPANFGTSQSSMAKPNQREMMPGVELDSIPSCVDFETLPWFAFPTDRKELSAMKNGSRYDALVPVSPIAVAELDAGSKVMFFEAASDPFGNPYYVPGGETLGLTLTKVRDEE